MNIVVIDYGLGNLASVYNALSFLGAKPKISKSPEDIEKADKLVLPGVGAFPDAMLELEKRNLIEPIKKSLASGKVYLGICLGLQILFEESEEGKAKGLGVFKGKVKRFRKENGIKIPHIGWNIVKSKIPNTKFRLMKNIENDPYFYFDHSYYAEPRNKAIVAGVTDYGVSFASMLYRDNIYAVQFHPERSQNLGLKMVENFIRL